MVDLLGGAAVCQIPMCIDVFQYALAYLDAYSVIEPANAFIQLAGKMALICEDKSCRTLVPSQQRSQNCCMAAIEG